MKFYKSNKGYFYKIKNNGDKVRIGQDTFNKIFKVGGVNINSTSPKPDTVNNSDPLQTDKSILYYLGITLGKDYTVITRQDIKNKLNKIPPFISKVFEDNPTLIMFVYKKQISDGICIYQVNNTINIKRYINTVSTSPTSKLPSYNINLNTKLNSKLYNNKLHIISDEVKKLLPPNTFNNTNVRNNNFLKPGKSILYHLGIALGKIYKVITREDFLITQNMNKQIKKYNLYVNIDPKILNLFNYNPNYKMYVYKDKILDGIFISQDDTIRLYSMRLKRYFKINNLSTQIKLENTLYNPIYNDIINNILKGVKTIIPTEIQNAPQKAKQLLGII